jgi:hypothetical protein
MARTDDIKTRALAHQFSASRYGTHILDEINKGYFHVVRKTEFRTGMDAFDFSTVAGTQSYSLPADYMQLVSLFNTDFADEVEQLDLLEFDDLDESSGAPNYFSIQENSIYFWPTPGDVFSMRLRYRKLPTELTLDDDPITPEEYDDVILDYVLWRIYGMEHDFEAAQYHKNLMDEGLINIRTDLNTDSAEFPDIVPGTWGR